MKNVNYLYKLNTGLRKIPHFINNTICYNSDITTFGFKELQKLIHFFKTIEKKFSLPNIEYRINYSKPVEFVDKLTYILLECLVYDLIVNKKMNININLKYIRSIKTEGVEYSCLKYLNSTEEFASKFKNDLDRTHLRRIISHEYYRNNLNCISLQMSEIAAYLKTYDIGDDNIEKISILAVELLDNALDHSYSDCLLDIDFSPRPYIKDGKMDQEFIAVSIVVIDFADKLLGEDIKNFLESDTSKNAPFKKLEIIKTKHEQYYNEIYNTNIFYMLASFQNRITGREDKQTGGTGLTCLIEALQESADSNLCYVVSGNNSVVFVKDEIKLDSDKWVGFNAKNNFEYPPNYSAIIKSPIKLQGTAYNLTFVLKKGEKNENN